MAENNLKVDVRLTRNSSNAEADPLKLSIEIRDRFNAITANLSSYFSVENPTALMREVKIREKVIKEPGGFIRLGSTKFGSRSLVIHDMTDWPDNLAHECGHALGAQLFGKLLDKNRFADESFARLCEVVCKNDGDRAKIMESLKPVVLSIDRTSDYVPFSGTKTDRYPRISVGKSNYLLDASFVNYVYFRFGREALAEIFELLPKDYTSLETLSGGIDERMPDYLRLKRIPKGFSKFEGEFYKVLQFDSNNQFLDDYMRWYQESNEIC